jgi:hypothetical protein
LWHPPPSSSSSPFSYPSVPTDQLLHCAQCRALSRFESYAASFQDVKHLERRRCWRVTC